VYRCKPPLMGNKGKPRGEGQMSEDTDGSLEEEGNEKKGDEGINRNWIKKKKKKKRDQGPGPAD